MAKKKTTPAASRAAVKVETKAPEKVQETKTEVKAETKAPEKAQEAKAAEKVETKKVTEKVETKKAAVKKAPAKKEPVKADVFVQFLGNEVLIADIEKKVTDIYVAEGHRASSIKSVKIYIKPEEAAAYYVINEKITGKTDLY